MILSTNLRLAPGTLTQYEIESNTAYLVANYPRQTDMEVLDFWEAVPKDVIRRQRVDSLEGSGGYTGLATGQLEWFVLTPNMIGYLWSTIFASQPRAAVTLRTYHELSGWVVYNAYLNWPFDGSEFTQQDIDLYSNVIMRWNRGRVAPYGRSYSPSYSASYG